MISARGGGLGREHGFALKGGAIRPGQHKDLLCQAKRQIGGQGIRMFYERQKLKDVVAPRQNAIAGRRAKQRHILLSPLGISVQRQNESRYRCSVLGTHVRVA